ncbi:hypothetical protein SAMN02745824_3096 [Parasphingorhabdus marina DSM 22363]|uniref:Uncharacterized protein n=1 Tax=Parasphingorhabdus marina DSM 22363 TaxID=1123272 RepID=A0A1N6H246_9SPHN|nr:hypothetical protein [Parasphingorhabdus marina]SIO13762.1 hypothetical protein SAMN02745824_3096 [Parasphingorhabdus marina DSM 22363]
MIIELLLLAVAFAGAWLILQPIEQFTYARRASRQDQESGPETVMPNLRNLAGMLVCAAAITTIFVLRGE